MTVVSTETEFGTLLQRVREGSQEAAWELVEAYGPYVLRTVRRSINREIRSKFDSQDFVQAVWASFFAHRDRLLHVITAEQLIAILAATAKHKIVDELRKRMTQKYSIKRERSLNDLMEGSSDRTVSREPRPSEVAIARERWNQMLQSQPVHYRQIVQLRFEGQTYKAIAERLDVSGRTVQRVLQRLL